MKNLSQATKLQQKQFLQSFDRIFFDIDGVLKNFIEQIPGTEQALRSLRSLNKKVHFVTNNCVKNNRDTCTHLSNFGLVNADDLINPSKAIVWYLKKINFDPSKNIFVVSSGGLKYELKEAGFKVSDESPVQLEESVSVLAKFLTDDPNVGAVVIDIDLNINHVKFQKAANYLKNNEDVIYLTGASDARIPIGNNRELLGHNFIHEALEKFSGKSAISLAKPSVHLKEYLEEEFQIVDKTKVLFVGDSVLQDMKFASLCGFQKLLVLSGITSKEDVDRWEYGEELKPQYYVESLRNLDEIISEVYSS